MWLSWWKGVTRIGETVGEGAAVDSGELHLSII